jgi:hypothetical protein
MQPGKRRAPGAAGFSSHDPVAGVGDDVFATPSAAKRITVAAIGQIATAKAQQGGSRRSLARVTRVITAQYSWRLEPAKLTPHTNHCLQGNYSRILYYPSCGVLCAPCPTGSPTA